MTHFSLAEPNLGKNISTATIVLSKELENSAQPCSETIARAKHAIQIARSSQSQCLITSGWAYRKDIHVTLADALKDYIKGMWPALTIPIIAECNPRDTVGDAFFSRRNIIESTSIQTLHVVTSDYHLKRCKHIFTFVFGRTISIQFHSIKTSQSNRSATRDKEISSQKAFEQTFADIGIADLSAIERCLYEKHPLYCGG